MALLKIVTYPDPVLREECKPIEAFDEELKQFAANMAETMYANDGVGLAAPQVGRAVAFIVVDAASSEERGKNILYLANPEVVAGEGAIEFEEACLSLPELSVPMKRQAAITVEARDLDGNAIEVRAEGFLAIVLQHEIDHLHGRLLVDYLSPLKRPGALRKLKKLKLSEAEEEQA